MRKVLQSGGAYTISLPAKYAQRLNLKKGDELEYTMWTDRLVYFPKQGQAVDVIKFDFSTYNRRSISRTLEHAYTAGARKIVITFKDQLIEDDPDISNKKVLISELISRVLRNYQGVLSVQKEKIIFEPKVVEEQSFKEAFLKMYFQLYLNFQDTITSIKKNDPTLLKKIVVYDRDIINPQYRFCLRALNEIGYKDMRASLLYYHIISLYEILGDKLRHLIPLLKVFRPSRKTIAAFEDIAFLFKEYFEPFKKLSMKQVDAYMKEFRRLEKIIKVKKTDNDGPIKVELFNLFVQMTHIIDAYIDQLWLDNN